jgi:hypothetical protein
MRKVSLVLAMILETQSFCLPLQQSIAAPQSDSGSVTADVNDSDAFYQAARSNSPIDFSRKSCPVFRN